MVVFSMDDLSLMFYLLDGLIPYKKLEISVNTIYLKNCYFYGQFYDAQVKQVLHQT